MKLLTVVGALTLTLTASTAFAQTAGTASPIDRRFAGEAAAGNTFEIRSSQMALQKSRDPAVRDMARWMIQSHTLAERKLEAAARDADDQGGAAPVVTPITEAMLSALSGLDGAAFDKAYVTDQVAAHQMTAQKLDDYRQTGSYGPLLAWDAQTAPEVNAHLAHFEAMSKDR